MGCGDEKLLKYLTQTFTAHCNAMICQQVMLSGDAEWPKVADAVIEALKRTYQSHPAFERFVSACGRASGKLKHTLLACLVPPTVRTKARFMHVHRFVTWADR